MSGGEPAENGSKEVNEGPAEDDGDEREQTRDETSRVETEDWAQHDPETPHPSPEN